MLHHQQFPHGGGQVKKTLSTNIDFCAVFNICVADTM